MKLPCILLDIIEKKHLGSQYVFIRTLMDNYQATQKDKEKGLFK